MLTSGLTIAVLLLSCSARPQIDLELDVSVDINAVNADASTNVTVESLAPLPLPTPIGKIPDSYWKILNSVVGGRLNGGHPYGAECFSKFSGNLTPVSNDKAKCDAAIKGYTVDTGITSDFGGFPETNNAVCASSNQGCILSSRNPADSSAFQSPKICYQGNVPQYYIDVRQPTDVIAAYLFSKKTGVPLSIKNTGHDYKARSAGADTLSLWTHNLKDMQYIPSYKAAGCSNAQKVVKIGAGVQLGDLYRYGEAQGFSFSGGVSSSVGASGGWLASAGHGLLAPKFGLGVDNVIEFKVVVPNGGLMTASRCQNTDLFFALAGGGPNSVGVVLESTHKVYPVVQVQMYILALNTTTVQVAKDFLAKTIPLAQKWASESWGAVYAFTPMVGQPSTLILTNPVLDATAARASIKPITDWAGNLSQSQIIANSFATFPSFYQTFSAIVGPSGEAAPFGLPALPASRLLPDTLWKDQKSINKTVKALTDYMMALKPAKETDATYGPILQLCGTTPYVRVSVATESAQKVTNPQNVPASGFTSETPYWRKAVIHAYGSVGWYSDDSTAYIASRVAALGKANAVLESLVPQGGAYQNEAYLYQKNYQETFWGAANYKKLLAAKAKYDPDTLLNCWQCVGFKGEEDPRYKCYSKAP